ncbi:MAG: CoA-binding protein [Candidatus Binatia bacterium]
MGRLTREEVSVERLLEAARSIAVLGVGAQGASGVVAYLKQARFEVFPVREDRAEIAGLTPWAHFADVPGPIDIVLVLSGAIDGAAIEEAARKSARALWLAPGVLAGDVEERARECDLRVVHDRDIVLEHKHTERSAGQPRKRGVHVSLRKRQYEDNRKRREQTGYVARGGGGHKGGGGGRAVLDEKKMVEGSPSPRKGPLRPVK